MANNMSNQRTTEEKLESFRIYTIAEEVEEKCFGVSTKLKLYEDPWKIKKVLSLSDTNFLSRLMMSSDSIRMHVLPLMDYDMVVKVESGVGAKVSLWDYDCGCSYRLTLKRWEKNNCYVLNANWTATVVKARGLTVGTMIGLFWDPFNSRFGFRVLSWGS